MFLYREFAYIYIYILVRGAETVNIYKRFVQHCSMVQDSLESPGLEVEEVQDEPKVPQDVVADEVHQLENEQEQYEEKACPVCFHPRPQTL